MRLNTFSDSVLLVEYHKIKSQRILKESCEGLTKKQILVVENVYRHFAPLIEATLTAQQVSQVFGEIEKAVAAGGQNKTALGKAAGAAGTAVKGGAEAVKKANEILNRAGGWLQNTTPVKGFDQKFKDLQSKVVDNLGGDNSKIVQMVRQLGDVAKKHPGKTAVIIGVMTVLAGLASGPVGGMVAGQVLRGTIGLAKGENISSVIGKGAKFAAIGGVTGGLAGGADAVGADAAGSSTTEPSKIVGGDGDWSGSEEPAAGPAADDSKQAAGDDQQSTPQVKLLSSEDFAAKKESGDLTASEIRTYYTHNREELVAAANKAWLERWPNSTTDSATMKMKVEEYLRSEYQDQIKTLRSSGARRSFFGMLELAARAQEGATDGVGTGGSGSDSASNESDSKPRSDSGSESVSIQSAATIEDAKTAAAQQIESGSLTIQQAGRQFAERALDINVKIGEITDWNSFQQFLRKIETSLEEIDPTISDRNEQFIIRSIEHHIDKVVAADAGGTWRGSAEEKIAKFIEITNRGKQESVYLQTRPLSEGQVYLLFNRVEQLNEGPIWDKVKQQGAKAASAVKSKASEIGSNLANKVTASKLNSAWKKAKEPLESDKLADFLKQQGISDQIIQQVFQSMNIGMPKSQQPTGAQQSQSQPNQSQQPTGAQQSQSQPNQGQQPTGSVPTVKQVIKKINKLTPKDKKTLLQDLQQELSTS